MLTRLTATQLLEGFAAGAFSPVEAFDAFAARIESVEPRVNAFAELDLTAARAAAERSARAYADGTAGPLEGVPVGIKDLFDAAGFVTAYGSDLFVENRATSDSTAVRKLREAGAIVVGKTMTHEFAWGVTTVNPHFGACRNPWDPTRIAGGSSGGSAAALACDMVPLALGSDTGGSIRIPAAYCGVAGLKPTYGRVSAAGAFPLARSLDHPGPMARTPPDLRLFLEVVAGADPLDPATRDRPLELAAAPDDLRGVKVGVSSDLMLVPLAEDVERVWNDALTTLEALGAELVAVGCPSAGSIYPTFVTIQRAEALFTHRSAGLYPQKRDHYGADVLGRLDAATQVTLDDYLAASTERARIAADFRALLEPVDVLVTPVSAGSPVEIGREAQEHFGETVDFRELVMPYTVPQDLTGLPACAVRAGFDELGIPVAVQFTADSWSERAVLDVAEVFARALPEIQGVRPPL